MSTISSPILLENILHVIRRAARSFRQRVVADKIVRPLLAAGIDVHEQQHVAEQPHQIGIAFNSTRYAASASATRVLVGEVIGVRGPYRRRKSPSGRTVPLVKFMAEANRFLRRGGVVVLVNQIRRATLHAPWRWC